MKRQRLLLLSALFLASVVTVAVLSLRPAAPRALPPAASAPSDGPGGLPLKPSSQDAFSEALVEPDDDTTAATAPPKGAIVASVPEPAATPPAPTSPPSAALQKLPQTEQESLWAALGSARRAVTPLSDQEAALPQNEGVRYFAANPGQQLTARFLDGAVRVQSGRGAEWQGTLRFAGFPGETGAAPTPVAKEGRVEYQHPAGVTEWYENRAEGIEHGFTVAQRPESAIRTDELRVEVQLDGLAVRAFSDQAGGTSADNVEFLNPASGRPVLSYGHLKVWDATGRELAARFETTASTVGILVADAGATYPVTIDPLIVSEEAKLLPEFGDGASSDFFGTRVALAGDTAVMGAWGDDTVAGINAGSAYVFVRHGGFWSLQQKILAADGVAGDAFGSALAMEGGTLIIGAWGNDHPSGVNAGAAYIFVRSGTAWSLQQKLRAGTPEPNAEFGASVAISGDTAAIGAVLGDTYRGVDTGIAYAFVRSGTVWTQQAVFTGSDVNPNDLFAAFVAISGDTILAGAHGHDLTGTASQGAAYVFVRSGITWTQQQKLTASDATANDDFDRAVALDGNTALIGAYLDDIGAATDAGSAYVFTRTGTTWTQQAKLTHPSPSTGDRFGGGVALQGNTALVSAPEDDTATVSDRGHAYVFVRSGTTWSLQAELAASDAANGDIMGWAMALDGDTALIGSVLNDHSAGTDAGSAYVFVRNGTAWSQQAQLSAGDTAASDYFGIAVSVDGDTALLGAILDDTASGNDSGSAYVMVRQGSVWSRQAKLLSGDAAVGDNFGYSVAVSGDTAVVGAPLDDSAAGSDVGSAYVFVRSGGAWSQQVKLAANDAATSDYMGYALSLSGESLLVGAYGDDTLFGNAGSAYVFVRSGISWSQQAKLTPGDPGASDGFGYAVALSGDTAFVGSPFKLTSVGGNAGNAYVFVRTGTSWSQQAKLTSADTFANDQFGFSVALSGNTGLIGARLDATAVGANAGSAYVFWRTGTTWSQQAKLTASDAASGDLFGQSVALASDMALVGALFHNGASGSAYVFARSGGTWSQQAKLMASDAISGDLFGSSVALSGDTVLVGARQDDNVNPLTGTTSTDTGSAYVFRLQQTPDPTCLGCIAANPGQSAKDILLRTGGVPSGIYWIDPDGPGGTEPFQVYCDMTTAGGGWMLAINSVQNAEAPGTDMTVNAGYVGLNSGHTRNLASMAIDVPAEIRFQVEDPASLGVFHAKWTFRYRDPLPSPSSPSFALLSGHTSINPLTPHFGQAWGTCGTASANWYAGACPGTMPAKLSDGISQGPVRYSNGGVIQRFSIWVRELTLPPLAREITVQHPAGTDLFDNGSSLPFGDIASGATSPAKTVTIVNSGTEPLLVAGVSLTGGNAGDFTVNTAGMLTSVPVGGTTAFSVAFNPTAAGLRTATLQIASNDPDENPFDITLTGNGLVAGVVDPDFNPNADAFVKSTSVQPDGKIVIGGGFANIGGFMRSRIARFNTDGTLDSSFNPATMSGYVECAAVQSDGKIVVGGSFTAVGGLARSNIERINSNGTLDAGFNPSPNGQVMSVAIQANGRIVIGGFFSVVGGLGRNNIARLTLDGLVEAGFDPNANGDVRCLAVQSDGKILIGGNFTTVGGIARNRIARLNADGTLDGSFDPNATGPIYNLAMQADGKIVIGGALSAVAGNPRRGIARLNSDGTLDLGFNPDPNASVFSTAVQADGKIVIGGAFTTVGGVARNRVARLDPDGTLDALLNPNANALVWSMALQTDGQILVGGDFTSMAGTVRNRFARLLNDPASQTLTVPSADHVEWLRGGSAPEATDVTFELWTDGSTWTALGVGTRINGGWELTGISLPSGGTVRARARTTGGQYNGSSGLVEQQAAFSGLPVPEIAVEQPAGTDLEDGTAVVAFGNVAIGTASDLTFTIKNTGDADLTGLGITLDGPDAALFTVTLFPTAPVSAPGGSTSFTVRFAPTHPGTGTATLHLASNDANENPFDITLTGTGFNPNSAPTALDLSPSLVAENEPVGTLVGTLATTDPDAGDTHTYAFAPGLGDTDNAAFTIVGNVLQTAASFDFETQDSYTIRVRTTDAGGLFYESELPILIEDVNEAPKVANGLPDSITGQYGNGFFYIPAVNTFTDVDVGQTLTYSATGMPPSISFDPATRAFSGVSALAGEFLITLTATDDGTPNLSAQDSLLFIIDQLPLTVTAANAARGFGQANPSFTGTLTGVVPGDNITATYSTAATTLSPPGTYAITPLLNDPNGKLPNYNVAANNGTLTVNAVVDSGFNAGLDSFIRSTSVQPDGKIVIGGFFNTVGAATRNRIARLNADGTLDVAFNPDANSIVLATAVQTDGKVVLGGQFTTVGGAARNRIARVNASGSLDTGFNPDANGIVLGMASQTDGKILIAGTFTTIGGTTCNRLARLNADGTLDSGFNPNVNNDVNTVVVQADGKILIGGVFSNVSGTGRNRIARLNADGTLDAGFNPNGSGSVLSLAMQADGKILVGGSFVTLAGTARNSLGRLNPDGTLDVGFNPNVTGSVASMAAQVDGRIVIAGGNMTAVDGTGRNYIARIHADGTLDTSFNPHANTSVASVALQADGQVLVGGNFTSIGGAARGYFARLLNDPATQTLAVPGADQIQWLRSGTAPETAAVSFELSTDGGTSWALLGTGNRISGGWELTGLALPSNGTIRALALTTGGQFNGCGGLIEQQTAFSGLPVPEIAVELGVGTDLVDGVSSIDFGTVNLGDSFSPPTLTIHSLGNAPLNLSAIETIGGNAGDFIVRLFTVPTPLPATLAVGGSGTFEVAFQPTAGGPRSSTLRLVSNDPDESSFEITLTGIGNANLSPTNISLDNASVPENQPVATAIGSLSAADPNAGDTHSFALIPGAGDGDNALFFIAANELNTAAVFNYEARNSFSIRVRATDNGGLSFEKSLIISVLDVNERPVANPQSVATDEDTAVAITLTGTDEENGLMSFAIVNDPAHGILSGSAPNVIYTAALNYHGPDSFTFLLSDGELASSVVTVSIIVEPVNDAPVVANAIPDQAGQYGTPFNFTFAADTFTDPDVGQSLSYSASGLPAGIGFDGATRTFIGTPTVIGTFPIAVTAQDDGIPAASVPETFDLVIGQAPLSVATASTSRGYGAANPPLTGTLTGVIPGDNITANYTTAAVPLSNIGDYPITPGLQDPDGKLINYTVSSTEGTLTVSSAIATVVANAKSKAYGEANPLLDAVVSGQVVGGDPIDYTLATTATQFSGVAVYPIIVTLGSNPNYVVTKTDSTLTVNPVIASVAANSKSKFYGEANPLLDAVISGQVVGGDPINYTLATAAMQFSGVGPHAITVTLGSNPNYTVTSADSTLTVNPVIASVAANSKSKFYGEANPVMDAVVSGQVIGGDPIDYTLATTATQFSDVAGYPITVTLGSNPNYAVTSTANSLTVSPAAASVAANPKSKFYGEANPSLDAVVSGQVVGGDLIDYTLATTATQFSDVAGYPIIVTLGSNPNYVVTKTDSSLTVNPALATVAAISKLKSYGEGNPALDAAVTGPNVGGDPIHYTLATTATQFSGVGSYPITVTLGLNPNYVVTKTEGALTVIPAPLVVSVDDQSRAFNAANPIFTASIAGLQNGDSFPVEISCAATPSSLVGTYPITPAIRDQDGKLANYTVSLVNGTLTITPAVLEVTIHGPTSGFLQTINTPISFAGSFAPTGNAGAYTALWIVSSASVPDTAVAGSITGNTVSALMQFPTPGVYLVRLEVRDAIGVIGEADLVDDDLPAYVVIYDPNGGFVTGGGWINSPSGAFHPDLQEFAAVTGKASFGFVAKYKKGANVPEGNTEFQFKAGNLNFKSTAYQWLVVAGAKAQYKGVGTINGEGEFGFMLTAVDGSLLGNGQPDRFRMKIQAANNNVIIYDNQAGTDDNSGLTDATIIGGGSIVIHKTK